MEINKLKKTCSWNWWSEEKKKK